MVSDMVLEGLYTSTKKCTMDFGSMIPSLVDSMCSEMDQHSVLVIGAMYIINIKGRITIMIKKFNQNNK